MNQPQHFNPRTEPLKLNEGDRLPLLRDLAKAALGDMALENLPTHHTVEELTVKADELRRKGGGLSSQEMPPNFRKAPMNAA